MRRKTIPEPWRGFLLDVDKQLPSTVVLHCLGGFAISLVYGLTRPTVDIDVCDVAPGRAKAELVSLAGEGSPLHRKHAVYLQIVTMASLPHDYESRLTEAFTGSFR